MRWLLIIVIRIYWKIIPANKRRNCIYNITCSKHVFETTKRQGLIAGLKALAIRYRNCRPKYELIYLADKEKVVLILSNGENLQQEEIATHLILVHKNSMLQNIKFPPPFPK